MLNAAFNYFRTCGAITWRRFQAFNCYIFFNADNEADANVYSPKFFFFFRHTADHLVFRANQQALVHFVQA